MCSTYFLVCQVFIVYFFDKMGLSIKTIFESTKKLSNLTNKQNRPLQFLLPYFKKLVDNDSSTSIIVTIHQKRG